MIESVIAQTYTNWQLIIIDDGSTDSTGSICDAYQNDKITVFHSENSGQIIARVRGIEFAHGDYTVVIDADDCLDKDFLSSVADVINNGDYDLVMFPYRICDADLIPTGEVTVGPGIVGEMTRQDILHWVIETYNHGLVNKVFKTELIKAGVKKAILDRLSVNGDYALLIPILCSISNGYYLDKVMYSYRVYSSSVSHDSSFRHLVDTDYVSNFVAGILYEYKLDTEENIRLVYVAYLHMIAWMAEAVVLKSGISKDELLELTGKPFYMQSSKYERKEYFGRKEYIYLKLIRYKVIGFNGIIIALSKLEKTLNFFRNQNKGNQI
jgi:glycosyltransferase involved in cell wall biosynthesis